MLRLFLPCFYPLDREKIHFYDPDGNLLEVYCNVPPEEYRKTVSNPYYNYGSIEDELSGKAPQRPGTVAP